MENSRLCHTQNNATCCHGSLRTINFRSAFSCRFPDKTCLSKQEKHRRKFINEVGFETTTCPAALFSVPPNLFLYGRHILYFFSYLPAKNPLLLPFFFFYEETVLANNKDKSKTKNISESRNSKSVSVIGTLPIFVSRQIFIL